MLQCYNFNISNLKELLMKINIIAIYVCEIKGDIREFSYKIEKNQEMYLDILE